MHYHLYECVLIQGGKKVNNTLVYNLVKEQTLWNNFFSINIYISLQQLPGNWRNSYGPHVVREKRVISAFCSNFYHRLHDCIPVSEITSRRICNRETLYVMNRCYSSVLFFTDVLLSWSGLPCLDTQRNTAKAAVGFILSWWHTFHCPAGGSRI